MKLFSGKKAKALSIVRGKNTGAMENPESFDPLNPQAHKNQFGLTGMWAGAAENKIVPVPEGAREELVKNVQDDILATYGGSGTNFDEKEAIYKKYLTATPENGRLNVSYSMGRIEIDEGNRVLSLIEKALPGWKPGQSFDRDFVRDLISGKSFDQKI
jgi:hypothetical protein